MPLQMQWQLILFLSVTYCRQILNYTFRWTIQYNCLINITEYGPSAISSQATPWKKQSVLSADQKFKRASKKVQKLAGLVANVGMLEFNEKMGIIDQLIDFWENKKIVTLVETVEIEPIKAHIPVDEEHVEVHIPVDEERVEAHIPVDEEGVEAHIPVDEEGVEAHIPVDEEQVQAPTPVQPLDEEPIQPLIPDVQHPEEFMEAHISDEDEDFANLMLPPKPRQRGRPKGAVNRVIGLPKKRKCTEKDSNARLKKVKLPMDKSG